MVSGREADAHPLIVHRMTTARLSNTEGAEDRHLRCECRNGTYAASAETAPTLRVPERHLRCECRNGTYSCACRNGTYSCECRNGTYLRVPKRHFNRMSVATECVKNCRYRSLSSRLERTFGPCEA